MNVVLISQLAQDSTNGALILDAILPSNLIEIQRSETQHSADAADLQPCRKDSEGSPPHETLDPVLKVIIDREIPVGTTAVAAPKKGSMRAERRGLIPFACKADCRKITCNDQEFDHQAESALSKSSSQSER